MRRGRPGQARSRGSVSPKTMARTNSKFLGKGNSQVPMSPTQVQDARAHPITDKPSPTNPHWGTTLGVPMTNPNNPYESGEENYG